VSGASPERARLMGKMMQAGRQLSLGTIMFHQAVADRLGLNATDHKCVDLLSSAGSMTAGELADATGLTTGAITGVIDRLERAGYVCREDDPLDRRRVIVRAIPERHREIGRLFESFAAAWGRLVERYDDQQLGTILDFMNRSYQVLHEAAIELRQQAPPPAKRKQNSKGPHPARGGRPMRTGRRPKRHP
jgi:DNA-binding MarR family transcriptional regulator